MKIALFAVALTPMAVTFLIALAQLFTDRVDERLGGKGINGHVPRSEAEARH